MTSGLSCIHALEMCAFWAVKHDYYIVELYGHEISFKWKTSENGNVHQHIFQSAILMEFIEGWSSFFFINRRRISKGIFFLWNFKSIYISPSNFIVAKNDEYDENMIRKIWLDEINTGTMCLIWSKGKQCVTSGKE